MKTRFPALLLEENNWERNSRFLKLVAALALMLGTGSSLAAGQIVAFVDRDGRRVYATSDDQELRLAAKQGTIQNVLALRERRHQALQIDSYIEQVAREHRMDSSLVRAVIEVESAWDPHARSRKGALGLMQLMPETAARFGVRDPLDPRENIRGGILYLRSLLDRFHLDLQHALAAYNAGENVRDTRDGNPPYAETRAYLARLIPLYRKLQEVGDRDSRRIDRVVENGVTVFTNLN